MSETLVTRPLTTKILNLLLISIIVCGALVAVWDKQGFLKYIAGISWLQVTDVEVETRWPLSNESTSSWFQGVEGESLLLLDTDALGEHLESQVWVKAVTIRKIFPDRLWVQLEPRNPVAWKSHQGRLWILDEDGKTISRWTSEVASKKDLPILSFSGSKKPADWKMKYAVNILSTLDASLGESHSPSEMVLDAYPYFRIFLQSPAMEILFSAENWDTQLPYLRELLRNPPRQTGQIRVISLLSPKKAVVRPDLSH